MSKTRRVYVVSLTLAGFAAGAGGISVFSGCQENLFSDSDAVTRSRINRYYNGDSALETSESRKRGGDSGFGLPMGGGSSY